MLDSLYLEFCQELERIDGLGFDFETLAGPEPPADHDPLADLDHYHLGRRNHGSKDPRDALFLPCIAEVCYEERPGRWVWHVAERSGLEWMETGSRRRVRTDAEECLRVERLLFCRALAEREGLDFRPSW